MDRNAILASLLVAGAVIGSTCRASEPVEMSELRERMVRTQIEARGVDDPRVLAAMRKVERHRFVAPELAPAAYEDRPLPIEAGQTISQPYIVAYMTAAIEPAPDMKVLEIGTGSGYQAAVLAEIVREVDTIEIVPILGRTAEARLTGLGYGNVHVRIGDGFAGWPEKAPFDAIVVTAAPPEIPPPLLEQLRAGGKLVIPVGDEWQELVVAEKGADGSIGRRSVFPVRFVPMTGEAQSRGGSR